MKEQHTPNNPYVTNKGGRIVSPKGAPKDEPKSEKIIIGSDVKGGKK